MHNFLGALLVHTGDAAEDPAGSPPALGDLRLAGDVLSWTDRGLPRELELG